MGILFCKDEISSEEDLERKALEDIYYALNGSSFWDDYNLENWLSSKPVGEWKGVITDNGGRVISLNVFENKIEPNSLVDVQLG